MLKWFAIPFSSEPHFVRTLYNDLSALGIPPRHGSEFLFFILFYFLTLQYCIGFAIYQHESATGIHVLDKAVIHVISVVSFL